MYVAYRLNMAPSTDTKRARIRTLRSRLDHALTRRNLTVAVECAGLLEHADTDNQARWAQRLGDLYRRMGQLQQAADAYQRAADHYTRVGLDRHAAAMVETKRSTWPAPSL